MFEILKQGLSRRFGFKSILQVWITAGFALLLLNSAPSLAAEAESEINALSNDRAPEVSARLEQPASAQLQNAQLARPEDFLSCASPRSAAASILHWLEPKSRDLARAITCVEGAGRSPKNVQVLADSLRNLINEKEYATVVETLSNNPNYKDPKSGNSIIAIHADLNKIILRKQSSGSWKLSRGALDQLAYLEQQTALMSPSTIAELPDWLRLDVFGLEAWQIFALGLVFVLGLITRKALQFILRRRLAPLVQRSGASAVASLVDVFAGPGSTLVVAGILSVFYPQLGLSFAVAQVMSVIVRALFIFALVFSAYRFVDVVADQMGHRASQTESKLDDQLVPLVRKALKVLVVIGGFLFLLQNLDVDVGSLLAGLGIGGVAVALAAKDTVANFFGSLMIFVDRPFQIGDWVKVAEVEGIVEEVGFRSTRVRTFYNSLVTIPNAHFTEASIDNMGQRQYRRTYTVLNLTYDTTPEQMEAFVEGIRAIIQASPKTRKDYYEVHLCGFGAHSLDVMVYVFFEVIDWSEELQQRHHLFLEIMRLAKALRVEFAFPTQTLHLASQAMPAAQAQPPASWSDEKLAQTVEAFAPGGQQSLPNTPLITKGYFAKP